ncbi:MAG TPA: Crp/Fnr family transcriptional regulator [Candidatus Limnocylindria bacterium]|nr:Crp/Fnr family transcriptional regulator [Candidatus Limnocylindria bacterium]
MGSYFMARISPDARGCLLATGRERYLAPGQLVSEAENMTRSGVVIGGRIRLFGLDMQGHEVTRWTLGAGSVVGLGALAGVADGIGTRAASAARIMEFDTLAVRRLRRDPGFMQAVAAELHQRFLAVASERSLLHRGGLARRVASELLHLIDDPDAGTVLEVTHEQLADALGSSREVVSRQLHRLGRLGLVEQHGRGHVSVTNPAALDAFVHRAADAAYR